MQWLWLGLLNVGRNKRRSVTSVLITAVATAAILCMAGFAYYTFDSLKEFTTRSVGHLVLSHPDYFQQEEEQPMSLSISDWQSLQHQWQQDERVRAVLPGIEFSGLISNGDKSTIFLASAMESDSLTRLGPTLELMAGKNLSHTPDPDADAEVMLGQLLARNLKAEPGSSLTLMATTADGVLNAIDVQVRGVFTTGVPERDQRLLYLHIASAQQLLVSDRVSTLAVHLYQEQDKEDVAQAIASQRPDIGISTWLERAFYYKGVKSLYSRIFSVMGIILACLVLFAIYNTMSMTVMERTREIGALRAMGTYPTEVLRNLIYEAGWISLFGVLAGMALTALVFVGLIFLDVQMPPPPGQSKGYPLRIVWPGDTVFLVAGGMMLLCLVSATIAGAKAVNRSITEALTYA